MKALVFTAPGTVELLDVPEPDPAPGDVLVQVRAAGICGSELHGARRPGFRKPPLIMGHEFAGVSADGAAVTHLDPVSRVTVASPISLASPPPRSPLVPVPCG